MLPGVVLILLSLGSCNNYIEPKNDRTFTRVGYITLYEQQSTVSTVFSHALSITDLEFVETPVAIDEFTAYFANPSLFLTREPMVRFSCQDRGRIKEDIYDLGGTQISAGTIESFGFDNNSFTREYTGRNYISVTYDTADPLLADTGIVYNISGDAYPNPENASLPVLEPLGPIEKLKIYNSPQRIAANDWAITWNPTNEDAVQTYIDIYYSNRDDSSVYGFICLVEDTGFFKISDQLLDEMKNIAGEDPVIRSDALLKIVRNVYYPDDKSVLFVTRMTGMDWEF